MRPCPKCRHPMTRIARVVKNITQHFLECVKCGHQEEE